MEALESHQISDDDQTQDHQQQLTQSEVPEITNYGDGSKQPGVWSSGLFHCVENPCNAIVTVFCPCLIFGHIAEIVDEGHIPCWTSAMVSLGTAALWFFGMPCVSTKLLSSYRAKLRKKFNIAEGPAQDWVIHSLCCFCALCQEYRELESRGFKPSIGWERNKMIMERNKNQQQITMSAPPKQRMDI